MENNQLPQQPYPAPYMPSIEEYKKMEEAKLQVQEELNAKKEKEKKDKEDRERRAAEKAEEERLRKIFLAGKPDDADEAIELYGKPIRNFYGATTILLVLFGLLYYTGIWSVIINNFEFPPVKPVVALIDHISALYTSSNTLLLMKEYGAMAVSVVFMFFIGIPVIFEIAKKIVFRKHEENTIPEIYLAFLYLGIGSVYTKISDYKRHMAEEFFRKGSSRSEIINAGRWSAMLIWWKAVRYAAKMTHQYDAGKDVKDTHKDGNVQAIEKVFRDNSIGLLEKEEGRVRDEITGQFRDQDRVIRMPKYIGMPKKNIYKFQLPHGLPKETLLSKIEFFRSALRGFDVEIEITDDYDAIFTLIEKMNIVDRIFIWNNYRDEGGSNLSIPVAIDTRGQVVCVDFNKSPHILTVGTTGSGKSSCLNSMIMGLMWKNSPADAQFVFIDPLETEFIHYSNNLYNLYPNDPISKPEKVLKVLENLLGEMEKRKTVIAGMAKDRALAVNNIESYNQYAEKKMPRIFVFFDEEPSIFTQLADTDKKKLETFKNMLNRFGQESRKFGIHFIVAAQRPVTEMMPRTFQQQMSQILVFKLNSAQDSAQILGEAINGKHANNLKGKGHGLFKGVDSNAEIKAFVVPESVADLKHIPEIKASLQFNNVQELIASIEQTKWKGSMPEKLEPMAMIAVNTDGMDEAPVPQNNQDGTMMNIVTSLYHNGFISRTQHKEFGLTQAEMNDQLQRLRELGVITQVSSAKIGNEVKTNVLIPDPSVDKNTALEMLGLVD